jgi:uncharacterized integral membrane protein
MRLLISIVLILFFVAMIGFLTTNLDSRVSITLWSTQYTDIPTFYVVLVSFILGFVFTAIIAVAEGARSRFENLKLRRELRKQENELNFLRTQPPVAPKPEPDELGTGGPAENGIREPRESAGHLPTAPVYGMDEDDVAPEPDDDVYSGGRAV